MIPHKFTEERVNKHTKIHIYTYAHADLKKVFTCVLGTAVARFELPVRLTVLVWLFCVVDGCALNRCEAHELLGAEEDAGVVAGARVCAAAGDMGFSCAAVASDLDVPVTGSG